MTHLEIDKESYKKIQEITMTCYSGIYVDTQVLVQVENYKNMLEDLLFAYDNLKEEFEDYKKNVAENYRQIPIAEQVGISNEDFM